MRLLLIARDTGSALQNVAFIKNCQELGISFDFQVYSEGIGTKVFEKYDVPSIRFELNKDIDSKANYNQVEKYSEEFCPDFVLLGLSSFDYGIDELVRNICLKKGYPCGVIQDYWGYLGRYDLDKLPDTFFVLDEQAKKITEKKTQNRARCIITGSPKHEAYEKYYSEWNKIKPLESSEENKIVHIGQPSNIPGIFENFRQLTETLALVKGSFKLFLKLHPADFDNLQIYENLLKTGAFPYEILSEDLGAEPVLCQADIITTCFSSAGIDHNYLQLYANRRMGDLFYINIGKELTDFIYHVIGTSDIPGSVSGMGKTCRSRGELFSLLNRAVHGEKSNYMEAVKRNLGVRDRPSKQIFQYIQ